MNPHSLYKYIHFNALLLGSEDTQYKRKSCFERGEIWYPKANTLNDPYECFVDIGLALKFDLCDDFTFIEEHLGALNNDDVAQEQTSLNDIAVPDDWNLSEFTPAVFVGIHAGLVSAAFSDLGILSLTEDPFDLRMWAHYGGNSSGICLEFERNSDNILGSAKTNKVKYVKKRSKTFPRDKGKCIDKILTTKFNIWSYEKEWRVCEVEGDRAYPFPGKVKRILFGLNCADETSSLIKNIFGPNIKYENVLLGGNYSLCSDQGIKHSLSQVDI